MIINEPQNNIKEWSHILNNLQNQICNMLTPHIVHLHINKNHTPVNHNPQIKP